MARAGWRDCRQGRAHPHQQPKEWKALCEPCGYVHRCKAFPWQRTLWLSRNDPSSPHMLSLQDTAKTNSGAQQSLPYSLCCTYKNLPCSRFSVCRLLPILALQGVVLLHLLLPGGGRSGGGFSPPEPPSEHPLPPLLDHAQRASHTSRAEATRAVPVGWRSCCLFLAGALGFGRR